MSADYRSYDRSQRFCLLLIAIVGAWCAWPAFGFQFDDGPPCCQPPRIITELNARPANESKEQLIAWLDARAANRPGDLDLDVTALEGACETDCSNTLRVALERLRESWARHRRLSSDSFPGCCDDTPTTKPRAKDRPIDLPGCCTTPSRRAGARAMAQSISTRERQAIPVSDPREQQFRSAVIQRLRSWKHEWDQVPEWLDLIADPMTVGQLAHLKEAMSGWCITQPQCPPAMVIGIQAIERQLAQRRHDEEVAQAVNARKEDHALRRGDQLATILTGVIAGLVTIIAALIPLALGLRGARRHTLALEGILASLAKAQPPNGRRRRLHKPWGRPLP